MDKKNITFILMIFIIIAGFFLYNTIITKRLTENKGQQIAEKTITNNLLNFRDKYFGFEFDYPDSFTVNKSEVYDRITLNPTEEGVEVPFLEIHILSGDKKTLINDSLSRIADPEKYKNIIDKNISVGSLEGRMIGNSGYKDTVDSNYREIFVEMSKGKIIFIKSIELTDKDLDTILSSFQIY